MLAANDNATISWEWEDIYVEEGEEENNSL
jgi:hypothetical protein